jgi:bifunctional DNA-binding transcriptional regulator/antitoxin component of YhaV-PrlF toxin-antitoxin module
MTKAKITKNGQISLPAAIRHRWAASAVYVEDEGDQVVVRPVPADPIEALRGIFAGPGPTSDEMRAQAREEDAEIEDRKNRLYGW